MANERKIDKKILCALKKPGKSGNRILQAYLLNFKFEAF